MSYKGKLKMKSIFKMAEEDPDFKTLLNVEFPDSFDFYEELRKLNNPEEKLNSRSRKMKTFGVFHLFDVDGGFGDSISKEDLICTFNSEEEAKNFIKKYEKPHVYDFPYHACGTLEVRELPTVYNEKDFWWLHDSEDDEEDEE